MVTTQFYFTEWNVCCERSSPRLARFIEQYSWEKFTEILSMPLKYNNVCTLQYLPDDVKVLLIITNYNRKMYVDTFNTFLCK